MNMKTSWKLFLIVALVFGISFKVSAQENIWSANYESPNSFAKDKAVMRTSFPKDFKLFNLNVGPLRQQLMSITDSARHDSTVISLPNADGLMERFEIYEASNFEPDLQARFPEIRAFSGRGITDPYALLKLSYSPQGIQTIVFRTDKEDEAIEAFSQDRTVYAVFKSRRDKGQLPWSCSTEEKSMFAGMSSQIPENFVPDSSAGQVKTMRLAQSCNGEYSNFFGAFNSSQVGLVLAAFNATLTRSNGVYEKDLAIHLNLIANTTAVIYYDPATDPYTTLGSWNGQLQTTLTSVIGEANYDIGHMFGASGGGGNAGCIGCVCVDGSKGSGITSPADGIPQGDNFDIDYVVHEVGHQMGANHTFSHTLEGTGVNKEVGAGITIMGYAGITSQDPAPHSIDIFHQASIQQIQTNMATKTCPVTTVMTANHPPVVTPIGPFTIPISTAFALTGQATDPENDPLTYNWEQNDNSTTSGNASVASPTKATGPNWLSFPSTVSPTRSFPRLSTILAGLFVTPPFPGGDAVCNIEALSSVSRALNFRLTVRDNVPYVPGVKIGQTNVVVADTVVNVTSTAGPFKVTAPNTNVSWAGGSSQTITWDVANTTAAPVSVANVKISLSFDNGVTFPIVLAANTANDGTETVTIPNTGTTTGRVKIEAIGNIFFDISDSVFSITGPTPTPTVTNTSTPTNTATATNTGTPSPSPTNTNTNTPTNTPTAEQTPCNVTTVSYTGPAVAIPDNVAAGVNINLPVSGVGGNISDLNFQFDTAGTCDATVGNANAAMDHTFIGDLTFKLTAPNGTTSAIFQARRGGTRENICLTTLDDEGGFPNVSTLTSVTGQFESGNFSPETTGKFNVFDGLNANGTWVLNVSDNAGIDTGSMRRFSLIIGSACAGTPTATSTGTPPPTSTNTATATNTATPTASPSCTPSERVADGTFEAGTPWPLWTVQTSTNFGSPNCNTALCGTGNGTAPPFAGDNWAWFGGAGGLAENATLGQTVTIPSGGTATLTFQMRIGSVTTPFTDTLTVKVDNTTIATFTEPATAEGAYTLRTYDISAFANGGSHALLFSYTSPDGNSNFTVDNVSIATGCGPAPTATNTATASPSGTPTNTNTATATATATPCAGTVVASYTGPAVAIPDNVAAGVDISIPVSGVGTVSDLNFRFDTAGTCDATVGNANAAMDHTFIGDLTFKLTAPNGTTSTIFQARRGGTRENICLTNIDDEGGFPNVSTLTSVTGQFESGNFSPETTGPLSAFDGTNANGTWVLNVSDNAGIDTGSMRRFSLIFNSQGACGSPSATPTSTSTVAATATPTASATATATPGGTPSGAVIQFSSATYTEDESQTAAITISRSGNTAGTDSALFSTSNGTATGGAACVANSGVDYVSVTNQAVTFNPGDTSKTVNVTICGDSITEPDQTVNLALTGSSVGAQSTAVLTINDTATTYRNTSPISVFQGGSGAPFPSTVIVAGGPPIVGSMRVTIYDYSTTNPDNVDFLLVGPGGQKFILLANAGGSASGGPVTLNFTDTAGAIVPDTLTVCDRRILIRLFGTVANFPAPAPASPYNLPGSTVGGTGTQTLFGNFGGTNSNGTWSLYLRDDGAAGAQIGSVAGGWGIEFLGSTAASSTISGRVTTADGTGIRNAKIVVTGNSLAEPLVTSTGSFGWFAFDGLRTGETYVVTVNSQRYTFSTPSRVISLVDNVVDADFIADPQQ